MLKRNSCTAALLALLLAVGIAVPTAQRTERRAAAETQTPDYGTISADEGGDGGMVWKTDKPNGYDALTIDLGEPVGLNGMSGELYLTLTLGGLRNPDSQDTMGMIIALEDGAGGRLIGNRGADATTPVYAVPALFGGTSLNALSWRQQTCLMFRSPTGSQASEDTVAFLPLSYFFPGTLESVRYVTLMRDNSDRWQEFKKISFAALPGLTPLQADDTNGFKGFTVDATGAAATPAEILAAVEERTLVDFTAFKTTAELTEKLTGGAWKTQTLASWNARKDLTYASSTAEYNQTFLSQTSLQKVYSHPSVRLNAAMKGALIVEQDPDGAGTVNAVENAGAANYDSDVYAHFELWSGDPVNVLDSDGFALKLAGVSASDLAAFRLYLYDDKGIRYGLQRGGPSSAEPVTMSFTGENGARLGIGNYYSNLWADAKSGIGTLYYGYHDLVVYTNPFNGAPAVIGPRRIRNVARVVLSIDNAAGVNLPRVLKRAYMFGMFADVKVDEGIITPVFDPAAYSYATEARDETSDVNPIDPTKGKTAFACNLGNDAANDPDDYGRPLAWKNELFRLRPAGNLDVLKRLSLRQREIGDVRVLEDFSLPEGAETLAEAEKTELLNAEVAVQDFSPSTARWVSNADKGYGDGLLWTVGDYNSQYVQGTDVFCKILFSVSTAVPDFSALKYKGKSPKGVTIYAENRSGTLFDFNMETVVKHPNGKLDRWSCYNPGTRVYLYDLNTGREFCMPTAPAAGSTIRLPAGFCGWVRLPFAETAQPAWTASNSLYEMADAIDFEQDALANIIVNTNMQNNSNKTVVFDNLGLYYADFAVASRFHGGGTPSMAGRLAQADYFA